MNHLDCDILIIGSGAAGGVLAATLAESTRKKIVLLEKGGHYSRQFFNQRELDMARLYADRGRRSTSDGSIPVRGGECVGGGTTINLALCFDPVRAVWEDWKRDYGLLGYSFDGAANDFGIQGLNMTSSLQSVRQRLHIQAVPDRQVNDNNRLLELGCQELGYTAKRFELNVKECLECGFCALGCAYDRKQGTMVTYIADAVRQGVQLVHHCTVDRILLEKDHGRQVARGVTAVVRETEPGSEPNRCKPGQLSINAQLVIVASGAVESPSLLLRSGHPDPFDRIGRGAVLHPSLPVIGLFDRELSNYRGISGSVYSDHFYNSHGFYLECLFGHPVYGATVMPGFGAEHFEMMTHYRKIAGFGVMLIDTPSDHNRVTTPVSGKASVIDYTLSQPDQDRLRFAAEKAVQVMLAAGANVAMLPTEQRLGPLERARFDKPDQARHCAQLGLAPFQTTITSAHIQSTVKMGESSERTIVNSRCESRHVRNLIVCDSSVFPTSCGANPMISIMTLAQYQGRRIAAEWDRYTA